MHAHLNSFIMFVNNQKMVTWQLKKADAILPYSLQHNLPFQQTENQLRQHGHHLISKHQNPLLSQTSLVVQVAVIYTLQAWPLAIQDDIQ